MYFPTKDLTNQFISCSYQDVVQQYLTSSLLYFLDGYGNSIYYLNSSSIGNLVITSDLTASMAVASASYLEGSAVIKGGMQFDTASAVSVVQEGYVFWDNTYHTLAIKPDITETTLQIGQEMWLRGVAGETIVNGQPVFISGSISINGGYNNLIYLAHATGNRTKDDVVGVSTHDFVSGSNCIITTYGIIHEVNTSNLIEGADIWLDYTTPGSLTSTKPPEPYEAVRIGQCIRSDPTTGMIRISVVKFSDIARSYIGVTSLPTITYNNSGSFTIGNSNVSFCSTADGTGAIRVYALNSQSIDVTLNNGVQYITATYNDGAPIYTIHDSLATVDEIQIVPVYAVSAQSASATWYNFDTTGVLLANKIQKRLYNAEGTTRGIGLILGESGSRNVTITDGTVWLGAAEQINIAVDSYNNEMIFHAHNGGVWSSSIQTQYVNDQYDDGTNLQTLLPNRYVVNWIYRDLSINIDRLSNILSNQYSTIADAIESQPLPDLPVDFLEYNILVGRILAKSGEELAAQLDSAFVQNFTQAGITIHNNLNELQGGIADEYYHLTATEYAGLGVSASWASSSISSSYVYGNLEGTASWAENSIVSSTSLYASQSKWTTSASFASSSVSSSYGVSASYALSSTSASYALSSISASYGVSASYALSSSYVLGNVSGNVIGNVTGTSSWASKAISASYAPTIFDGKTDNYVPKWSASVLTATSLIYDDGTRVGIGTAVPLEEFHVRSNVLIGDVLEAIPVQIGNVLTPVDANTTDKFGFSTSLSSDGNILIVGATRWEGEIVNQGGVYTFDWNGTLWIQRGNILKEDETGVDGNFGKSTAISADGTILAVGADVWYGEPGGYAGRVYIYDWNGSTWVKRGNSIIAADAEGYDYFGSATTLSGDGNILVVGAYQWDGTANNQGAVYTYDWTGSTWVQRGDVLTSDDPGGGYQYGTGVALSADGSILIVGAQSWTGTTAAQGAAYTYDWNGTAWIQRGSVIVASFREAYDYYAHSVAISSDGNILCVGVVRWSGLSSTIIGAVYIYDWNGSIWIQRGDVLTASDPGADDWFGSSVALQSDGSRLIVGASTWDNISGNDHGCIYTYQLPTPGELLFKDLWVTGAVLATSFTGSLFGTASWANNSIVSNTSLYASQSNWAISASWASSSVSSSYVLGNVVGNVVGNLTGTASWAENVNFAKAYTIISSSYTILPTDYYIYANAVTSSIILTLPTSELVSGQEFKIKKIDQSQNEVIISSSVNIDYDTELILSNRGSSITIQSTSTQYWIH